MTSLLDLARLDQQVTYLRNSIGVSKCAMTLISGSSLTSVATSLTSWEGYLWNQQSHDHDDGYPLTILIFYFSFAEGHVIVYSTSSRVRFDIPRPQLVPGYHHRFFDIDVDPEATAFDVILGLPKRPWLQLVHL
ncbi:hypothetical protein ACFE04_027414 [Oxalis oulophora]